MFQRLLPCSAKGAWSRKPGDQDRVPAGAMTRVGRQPFRLCRSEACADVLFADRVKIP